MALSSPQSVPPPPSSPLSGSNSDDSAAASPAVAPPPAPKVEAASENGNTKTAEERPDLSHFERVHTSFLGINKYIKGFNVGGADCKTMYVWSSITNCRDSLIGQEFLNWSFLDSAEYRDKVKKYEADFTRRLMTKYFSNKNFYGGNIFDEKSTIDDQTIMSSKWHCTQTFVDPAKVIEEQSSNGSTSTSET